MHKFLNINNDDEKKSHFNTTLKTTPMLLWGTTTVLQLPHDHHNSALYEHNRQDAAERQR